MRRFLFGVTVICVLLAVAGIGTTAALAATGPLEPGDALFPWQYYAEQRQTGLFTTNLEQAQHFISLAGRRAANLQAAAGTSDELLSVYYLNQALDQAALSIATIDGAEIESLHFDLARLVLQIRNSIAELSILPKDEPLVFEVFVAKIDSLQNLIFDPDITPNGFNAIINSNNFSTVLSNTVNVPSFVTRHDADQLIASGAQSIPFPANSPGAQHEFFPLIGEHANLACESCHVAAMYVGTANTCEACHANMKPENHYNGDCATCHMPTAWHDINFDHAVAGARDCESCHSVDKPNNHFDGQCSTCHSTLAWLPAQFSHAGQTDCQACHRGNKPANHFDGQCSTCHNTLAWLPAHFNHAGQTDCQSCHNRPSGHYDGQCSKCHTTTATWSGAAIHVAGADCTACHSRPAGHYAGQCSQCHTTSNWTGASGHFAGADCTACHSRPAGHYAGQCSQCHTTSNWTGASGHFAGANCTACHSGHTTQQCSTCHNTSDWDDADDDDHGGDDHDGDDHDD